MDIEQAHILNNLNRCFYKRHSASFSESRNAPWEGWLRVLEHIVATSQGETIDLLDIACGNGRFETYAVSEYPGNTWRFTLIDNDRGLLNDARLACEAEGLEVRIQQADVVAELLAGKLSSCLAQSQNFKASVSFGFMHHIPGRENRVHFMSALSDALSPGGIAAISLWRFADNNELAQKAQETTERIIEHCDYRLEPGDYFLGWQGETEIPRYCHSFNDNDIDELIKALSQNMVVIDRFRSDGRDNQLNEYLVFARS